MFNSLLPKNCPPAEATEEEKTLYRLFVHEKSVIENFLPYSSLYPEVDKYKNMCGAYGISLFDKKETAISYSKKFPKLGGYVAEVIIKPTHGKLKQTNKTNGHYNLWLYKNFDPSVLECKIETIHVS